MNQPLDQCDEGTALPTAGCRAGCRHPLGSEHKPAESCSTLRDSSDWLGAGDYWVDPDGAAALPCDGSYWRGSCCRCVEIRQTWDDAETSCRALGGHLASIASEEESAHTLTLVGDRGSPYLHHWLGLGYDPDAGAWTWTDQIPTDFSAWSGATPAPVDTRVVSRSSSNRTWNGTLTSTSYTLLCERGGLPATLQHCD